MSLSDELASLAQLHADGVLSEEEFKTAKATLLEGQRPRSTVLLVSAILQLLFGLAVILGVSIALTKDDRKYPLFVDLIGLACFGVLPALLGAYCFWRYWRST